jgi:hypothetical protein
MLGKGEENILFNVYHGTFSSSVVEENNEPTTDR